MQHDVYGELMDALYQARRNGLPDTEHVGTSDAWALQRALVRHLEGIWREPDEGIWEVRGARRHFTHSKVMAWVALDRSIRSAEEFGLEGPVARWREVRDAIHADVCAQGYSRERGAFVQSYGSRQLDASLLLIPLVGFLPPTDERVRGTAKRWQPHGRRPRAPLSHGETDDGRARGKVPSWHVASGTPTLLLQGRRASPCLFERLLALRTTWACSRKSTIRW